MQLSEKAFLSNHVSQNVTVGIFNSPKRVIEELMQLSTDSSGQQQMDIRRYDGTRSSQDAIRSEKHVRFADRIG